MRKLLALLLGCQLGFSLTAADITAEDLHGSTRHTNAPTPLVASQNDPLIAKLTSRMLERQHYLRMPFTAEVGSKFLDRYLDSLDNFHIYFLQSDLKEFEPFRQKLNDMTMRDGDTSPSRVIFNRFRERLQEQYDYATNLLHTEQFTFTGDEKFALSRKTAPRPKDMDEAKRLWRERLRYEYLQEKLGIGRPEVIGSLILEKLNANKPGQVRKAIQDKVSKEKGEEIAKLVNQNFPAKKPDEVVKLVVDKLNADNAQEIVKIISRRYTRVLRFLQDYDNDDVLQVYLTALAHVYDPHSDYMGKAELENFSIGMKLSLFGIGALLRSEDGICKIQELKPGPAQRSGKMKPNDKIIAVAQGEGEPVDVVDMPLKKVVDLIRGPKGSEVRLTVIPADAPDPSVRKIVSLQREEIKLEDQEAKAKLYEIPDNGKTMRLGVIDLPSFYSSFELEGRRGESEQKSTTTDVAKLITKLAKEHVSGIVLDLRRNGGGSLEEAINLTGLFLNGGPVVQVKDSDGTSKQYNGPSTNAFYNGPLIVLTSRFSASASEILAGALQDYGRALIVGDSSTHGKGTVQSLVQLGPILRGAVGLNPTNNPGALKITIRKFYRASGSSTQLRGVVPNLVLPSVNNELEVGEKSLENPLDWDEIKPATGFSHSAQIDPIIPELKKRSEARLATDHDFAFVGEEIQRYKKAAADKSVSLNEAQRLKEKQEADDRAKARKKELASRPPTTETTWELKLKDTDLPGLPAPEKKTNQVAAVTGDSTKPLKTSDVTTNMAAKDDPQPSKETAETPGLVKDDLDPDETAAEDITPAIDITLDETKRILMDMVKLLPPDSSLAVSGGANKKPNGTVDTHNQ